MLDDITENLSLGSSATAHDVLSFLEDNITNHLDQQGMPLVDISWER